MQGQEMGPPDHVRIAASGNAAATVLRNITLNGRRTSMRLEPEMWATLKEIARREQTSVADLCADVDRGRGPMSLTAAVRSRIVSYLREGDGATAIAVSGRAYELIRRYRFAMRERAFRQAGSDYEDTITFDPSVLSREAHSYIAAIFNAWWECRSTLPGLPSFADLADRVDLLRHGTPVYSAIDVSSENPANFVIAASTVFTMDRFGQSFAKVPVRDFPVALHARAMQLDFHAARQAGEPIFQITRQQFGAEYRDRKRLLVPVSEQPPGITHILVVVEPLSGPHIRLVEALRTRLSA
jgi:predicted DNA-binding ribbon-helix-helix protein